VDPAPLLDFAADLLENVGRQAFTNSVDGSFKVPIGFCLLGVRNGAEIRKKGGTRRLDRDWRRKYGFPLGVLPPR
jgi:hypothetical protein